MAGRQRRVGVVNSKIATNRPKIRTRHSKLAQKTSHPPTRKISPPTVFKTSPIWLETRQNGNTAEES